METCPLNRALTLIGGKWKMQILCSLHNNGPTRYNQLKRSLDGVSNTVLSAALREVREESGLRHVRPISDQIYSLEILTVDGHEKRGRYVPSHLHLNITYLLEASPAEAVRCKPDENSRVGWFPPEEAEAASSEPWFRERIYTKLNAKLADFH